MLKLNSAVILWFYEIIIKFVAIEENIGTESCSNSNVKFFKTKILIDKLINLLLP